MQHTASARPKTWIILYMLLWPGPTRSAYCTIDYRGFVKLGYIVVPERN